MWFITIPVCQLDTGTSLLFHKAPSLDTGLQKMLIFSMRQDPKIYLRLQVSPAGPIYFCLPQHWYNALQSSVSSAHAKKQTRVRTRTDIYEHIQGQAMTKSFSLAWQPHSSHILPKCSSKRSVINHALRTGFWLLDFKLFTDSKKAIAIS